MTSPTPPIFIIDRDGGDLRAFPAPQAAAGFMEPPEAEQDAYVVLDRFGHQATLGIDRYDVTIQSWSIEAWPDRLRKALAVFLAGQGHPLPHDATLEELVTESTRVATEAELARTHPRALVPVLRWLRSRRAGPTSGA